MRKELGRVLAGRTRDRGALVRLVRARPQDVRLWGEGWAVKNWADAYLSGSAAVAERALNDARDVAAAYSAEIDGDRLFADAIAAIDATRQDRRARERLANAYSSYAKGRALYALHDDGARV